MQWQWLADMRHFPLFIEIQPVMCLRLGPCFSSPLLLLKHLLNQGAEQAQGNLAPAPHFLTCPSEAV